FFAAFAFELAVPLPTDADLTAVEALLAGLLFFAAALRAGRFFVAVLLVVAREAVLAPVELRLDAALLVRVATVFFVLAFFAGAFRVLPADAGMAFRRVSKRRRISAISMDLSSLRWLAWPLVPRLLPVRSRLESFCRLARSRARSRASRARLIRDVRALSSSPRIWLARLSS